MLISRLRKHCITFKMALAALVSSKKGLRLEILAPQ